MLYYNLELFGSEMKKIRLKLNLKRSEIARNATVADKTIKRYESGKVMPNFDILEDLSPFYKTELVALLIQCRFDDYSAFYEIKKRIEVKLYSKKEDDLKKELKDLNILSSSTKNKYCIDLINQLVVFLEAIELYSNEENDLAHDKFIESIKVTSPNFNFDKYSSYIFSSMEVRILMNIALIFYKANNDIKCIEIMEFCISSIELNDEICPTLCNNLAGVYVKNKNYQKTLEYSNIGIQSCIESQNSNCLSTLYYVKGYAECRLNMKEYMQSLNTSIYLCKAFKQDKLRSIIMEKCKKYLDVDLSNIE